MKMRRIAGLLLTVACAVSLLCPAAWAVNASSVDKSGSNVRLSYRLQMPAVEDSAKIGADVKAQVKTTARRTSNSVVEIGMNSRADAESQLGMKFVSSSTFDALPQGGGTDNVVAAPGASYAKADYTAANGQVYQIYSVKDAAGNVTAQYAVFQHGATTYLLCAQSTGAMPQNYLNALLDTLNYPA